MDSTLIIYRSVKHCGYLIYFKCIKADKSGLYDSILQRDEGNTIIDRNINIRDKTLPGSKSDLMIEILTYEVNRCRDANRILWHMIILI